MKTQTIGIKELHTRLKKISEEALRGRAFVVMKNTKPVFRIEPLENSPIPRPRKYTIKDLKKVQFNSKKDLSKNIDAMLYGK